jgi:hypothetical protein
MMGEDLSSCKFGEWLKTVESAAVVALTCLKQSAEEIDKGRRAVRGIGPVAQFDSCSVLTGRYRPTTEELV